MPNYGLLDEEEKLKAPVFNYPDTLIQLPAIERNETRIQPAEKSDQEMVRDYIRQKIEADKKELSDAKDEARQKRMGLGIMESISSGIGTITGAKSPDRVFEGARLAAEEPISDVKERQANWKTDPNDPRNVALRQSIFKSPKAREELIAVGVDPDQFTIGSFEDNKSIHDLLGGIRKADLEFGQKMSLANAQQQRELQKQKRQDEKEERRLGTEPEFKSLPKESQDKVEILGKDIGTKSAIASEIDQIVSQLDDPNISDDQKLQIGRGALKIINSTQGKDAIGAEEAKRLGSYLEFSSGLNPFSAREMGDFGRNIDGFKEQVRLTSERLKNSNAVSQDLINKEYAGAGIQRRVSPQPEKIQTQGRAQMRGLSPEKQKRLEELRAKQARGDLQ